MQQHIKNIIETYFEKEQKLEQDLFNQLVMYIYSLESDTHDIYMLAQLLPDEYLTKLIFYFDGDTLRLPSKKEYKLLLLTALCFWLKEFKNLSWKDIKEIIDFDNNEKIIEVSTINLGNKITKLKKTMGNTFVQQLANKDIKEMVTHINNKYKTI